MPVKANFSYHDKGLYKDIFGFSLWTTVSALAQRMVFNIIPSILGAFVNSASVAVFGVVSTIEGYTYTITSAINGMFLPKIARMYQTEDAETNLPQLFLNEGRYQYALNGLIITGFAVLGKSFIDLWIGSGYEDAYYGILLVVVPGIFYNSLEIANAALVAQKKVKLQAHVSIVTGITNVILSLALSHFWGMLGACFSIFVAYMLRAVMLNVIAMKVLRFDISLFIKQCYLKMSVPILITIIFGVALNVVSNGTGWLLLGIKGVCVVTVYILLLYCVGLNKEERKSLSAAIKCVLKR
jgi:O-antigen/teichoic acid export membrane protein